MLLFKKPYTIRKHGEQSINKGYASSPYTDGTCYLNVQPLNPNEMQALPNGQRTVKRLKSFGADPLAAVDQQNGIPGDWLYYMGFWYECTSSVLWDHTPLKHYRSEFVIVPESSSNSKPPGCEVEHDSR